MEDFGDQSDLFVHQLQAPSAVIPVKVILSRRIFIVLIEFDETNWAAVADLYWFPTFCAFRVDRGAIIGQGASA